MNALANVTSRVVQRYLPDAFVLAILLTFLVVLAALGLTDSTPVDVVMGLPANRGHVVELPDG